MVARNTNRWTPDQIEKLCEIIDEHAAAGRRIRWKEEAPRLGHPISACQQMANKLRHDRRELKRRAELRAMREKVDRIVIVPDALPRTPKVQNPEFTRATSTYRYTVDAELRARIESQGVTAGLLGDPPAGRSALDQKRGAAR